MKITNAIAGLGFAFLMFTAPGASAGLFTVACGGAVDVDDTPATQVTCNVTDVGTITDINVYLNIDDPVDPGFVFVDDYTSITLSNSSHSATLFEGTQSFALGNMDATFDDEAVGPATPGPIVGTFTPVTSLHTAFDNDELFGTWTLAILDEFIPGEGNELFSWNLVVTTADQPQVQVPEPSSFALLGFGLAGLVRARRRKAAK